MVRKVEASAVAIAVEELCEGLLDELKSLSRVELQVRRKGRQLHICHFVYIGGLIEHGGRVLGSFSDRDQEVVTHEVDNAQDAVAHM